MEFSSRETMLTLEIIIYISLTAWLIVTVGAYKSGCIGEYCFVISDIQNNNERLDQSTAQQRCQSNATQLIEIRNQNVRNSLIDFIKSVYSQGLNKWNVLSNGKRLGGNWIRLSGNGIGGLNIYEQTDSSYAYGYLKANYSGFGLYASRPTDNKGGFICADLSDCSGGVTISGLCYKSFAETLSWYDARNRCLNGGGDLASFDYITSNTGFNTLNISWISISNSFWIGIRREWWTWQGSNSDVKYSDWMTGHPINYQTDTDCLCLSTSTWMWTECGCSQQLPFVCFSANSSTTSITTRTTPTTTSTVFSSTTKTTTSGAVSQNNDVSSPTIPPTVTSTSTPIGNDTGVMDGSTGLGIEATIGIGVGVGGGGALIIIALVAVVVILWRKRSPLRCLRRKKTSAKAHPPDILMTDSANNNHSLDGIENPYALVVSSSPGSNDTGAHENVSQASIVYAELGFSAEPQLHRLGSVTIVPGKTKPSQNSTANIPNNNTHTHHFNVGGALYAEITKTEV